MKAYLTYCKTNHFTALKIDQALQKYGAEFRLDTREEQEQNRTKRLMRLKQDPVFMLISDNFLKSQQCMRGILAFVNDMGISRNIYPILIEGEDENGQAVKTELDAKIYVEYWNEKYKALRAKKDEIQPEDEEKYNWEVMVVRRISNEILPFFEALRKRKPITLEAFQADNHKAFFAAHGIDQNDFTDSLIEEETTENEPITIQENNDKPSETTTTVATETPVELTDQEVENNLLPHISAIVPPRQHVNFAEAEETLEVDENIDPETIPTEDELKENTFGFTDRPPSEDEAPQADSNPVSVPNEDLIEEETAIIETKEHPIEPEIPAAIEPIVTTETPMPEVDNLAETPEEETSPIGETLAPVTWEDAYAAEAIGDYAVARIHYENLLEKTPDHAEGNYRYGLLLLHQFDDKAAAIKQFHIAVEQKSKYTEAWLQLAQLAEKDEDYAATKHYYQSIIAYDKDNAEVYYRLGNLTTQYFDELVVEASNYYEDALKIDPTHNDARYEFAVLLYEQMEEPVDAIEELHKVLENDPEHPFAHFDLAILYRAFGKKRKAHRHYKKAIQLSPIYKTPKNDRFFKKPKKKKKQKSHLVGQIADNQENIALSHASADEVHPQARPLVLITGATSGIGEATAKLFAQNGYNLIITGRRAERLETLQANIEAQYDSKVKILTFDVRDPQAVSTAISSLDNGWENIDILVNNAGLAKGFSPIHEGDLEDWETMIDTNFKGLLYMTRAISPSMVARSKGHIINIGSSAGKEAYPNGNVYCGTKHAVDALTRGMRMDLTPHGIRVSSVSPGHVNTEFAEVRFNGDTQRANKTYENFSPLTAADIADAIYYVATRPARVNIQDIYMFSQQQASALIVDRSGDKFQD